MFPHFSQGPAIHRGSSFHACPQSGQSTITNPSSATDTLRARAAFLPLAAMPEGDPAHQFQMLLKPLERALQQENLEVALRFAGHLFALGNGPADYQDRKVNVLLRAMERATPSVKAEFTAKVLAAHGADLSEDARGRLTGRLERL